MLAVEWQGSFHQSALAASLPVVPVPSLDPTGNPRPFPSASHSALEEREG